jgi:hypothetical protein
LDLKSLITDKAGNFTDHLDTPASIVADEFVRGNGAGTDLIFFDLFGTANTWTAENTFNNTVNTQHILPTTTDIYDLGSGTFQWQDLFLSGNITLSNFTEDSVLFIGASGIITEDTSFNYVDGTNKLSVEKIEALQDVTAKAGENINAGQPVYILDVAGDKPEVFLASNDLHNKAHDLGIAIESKTTGQNINIGTFGEYINADTSAYSTGRLHLGLNGSMQNAVVNSGSHIHMGWVTKVDASEGIIFIKPVDYIHDIRGVSDQQVEIACGANDASGYIDFQDYSRNSLARLLGTGLFGIGTVDPDMLLQVEKNIDNSASVDNPLSTIGTSPVIEIQNPNTTTDSWTAYTLGSRGSTNDKWFLQSIYRGVGQSTFRIGYDQAGGEVYKPAFTIDGASGRSTTGFLGEEKITNGDFSSSANWTVGTNWAIAGGVATRSTGTQGNLSQSSANMVTPLVIGETYLVSFDIDSVDVSYMTRLTCGGVTIFASLNETGYASAIFTASNTDALTFDPQDNNVAIVIDNVSLRKIIRKNLIVSNWLGIGVEPQYPLHINAETNSFGLLLEGTGQTTPSIALRSNPSTGVGASTFSFNYDGSNQWVHFTNTAFKLDDAQRILFGAASQGSIQYDSSIGLSLSWIRKPIFINTRQYVDLGIDSVQTRWGTSDDAYVAYNGGDFLLNPQEVGSGGFGVAGDLYLSDYSSLGAELVINGDDFSSGWTTTGWTITGGTAVHDSGNTNALSQSIGGLTPNKWYKLNYEIESNPGNNGLTVTWSNFSKVHTVLDIRPFEILVRATSTSHTISFTPTSGSTVTIDDVSIKELGNADLNAGVAILDSINTTEFQVEADGDTYWVGDGTGVPYAQIYEENGSSTLALPAQDTFYQITAFTVNGENNDGVPDHTNDHITIGKAGRYLVSSYIAISSATANEYDIHVQKNNGSTDFLSLSIHLDTNVANKTIQASATGILDLENGDTIELWVKRLDGGAVSKTITIVNASITLSHIGGT